MINYCLDKINIGQTCAQILQSSPTNPSQNYRSFSHHFSVINLHPISLLLFALESPSKQTNIHPSLLPIVPPFHQIASYTEQLHFQTIIQLITAWLRMQERNEIGCNCISSLFNPQENWFLVKKKDAEDVDVQNHQRRNNKSADIKDENEPKSQKKSLKKRQKSNASSEAQLPQQAGLQERQAENLLRISLDPHQPFTPESGFHKMSDSPVSSSRQVYTPVYAKQLEYSPKERTGSLHYDPWNSPLFYEAPSPPQQHSPQRGFPIQQHPTPLGNNSPIFYSRQPSQMMNSSSLCGGRQGSMPYFHNHPQQSRETGQPAQKIHYPTKYAEQQTESWIPVRQDSLIIEEFDRLFKNREEHQSHANLNGDKTHLRAREAKKSKRYEKQQLVGRFAESDDDACSDPASELIGKGFENHFLAFWEKEEGYPVEETMATRSTNTKLSELHKIESTDPDNPKFGAADHFKSYKYL